MGESRQIFVRLVIWIIPAMIMLVLIHGGNYQLRSWSLPLPKNLSCQNKNQDQEQRPIYYIICLIPRFLNTNLQSLRLW